ncbi:MAG: type II toxin-antitoxin system RelE/ParE family toxin [Balneola sp.]
MDVNCSNTKLQNIYETGKPSKKYRLSQDIIDKFIMRVDALIAAETIHDLWKHPALNFEKLKGSDEVYSLRLNKQYRLEVSIEWTNNEKTIGVIDVLEISNHYD